MARTQFYTKDSITYEWSIEDETVCVIDWWKEPTGIKPHKEQCEIEAIEAEISERPDTWAPEEWDDYD